MTREDGLALLKTHVQSDTLLRHALAVEGAMRGCAEAQGEDVERWGLCGLLHDIDFEAYPETHPLSAKPILEAAGFDDAFIQAVLAHGDHTGVPRDTAMAKALYAVDELSSFIVAAVLVRPDRFEGLKFSSIRKKMKDKAFARAVSREGIEEGAALLGLELSVHVDQVIESLSRHEAFIKPTGLSLID